MEDGSWVNPPDFGAPQCTNWNWPLQPNATASGGQFDIPNGWALNERNWAVITATTNLVETAEKVSGGVRLEQIQEPTSAATAAELAWHFFLPSLNSGFMYYSGALDMPVKPVVACNLANGYALQVLKPGFNDTTAPTIWAPQRLPWNPGAYGMGALWSYKMTLMPTDFYVWTFVADASPIKSVMFGYRVDSDGENPLDDHANEVLDPEAHGLGGVGPWVWLPMTQRVFPKGNVFNETLDFTCDSTQKPCLPTAIADEYFVKVTGLESVLIDYHIVATDSFGNVKTSDIYHVYVDSGKGNGN